MDFVDRQEVGVPFYLQLNYTAPHFPWEGREDLSTSAHVTEAVHRVGPRGMFHFDGGSLTTYHSMVAALDEGVGRVMAALEARDLTDNTIVIFASDNGGERWAFMWPLVGKKGDLEEGGIRVPFIVRWPAVVQAGNWSSEPVVTMDWTATLLEAAGISSHPDYPLDGTSLLGWLSGREPLRERTLLWRTRGQGAARRGSLKMVHDRVAKPLWHKDDDYAGSRTRLYDLDEGVREMADIAQRAPSDRDRLYAAFREFDQALLPYPAEEPEEGVGGRGLKD